MISRLALVGALVATVGCSVGESTGESEDALATGQFTGRYGVSGGDLTGPIASQIVGDLHGRGVNNTRFVTYVSFGRGPGVADDVAQLPHGMDNFVSVFVGECDKAPAGCQNLRTGNATNAADKQGIKDAFKGFFQAIVDAVNPVVNGSRDLRVKTWGVNEPNLAMASLADWPERAALYYVAEREVLDASGCGSCRMVAGELSTFGGPKMDAAFKRYVTELNKNGQHPTIFSLHPYGDVNAVTAGNWDQMKAPCTDAYQAAVKAIDPHAEIWLTEIGRELHVTSVTHTPDDEWASGAYVRHIAYHGMVKRVYWYHMAATPGWDSALADEDGHRRASFFGFLGDGKNASLAAARAAHADPTPDFVPGAGLPIAVHTNFLQSQPFHDDGNPKTFDGHPIASSEMIAHGVENVVVTNRPPSPFTQAQSHWDHAAADWRQHGGTLAMHITPGDVVDHIGNFPGFVRNVLNAGYDYVAMDEIEPTKAAELKDGTAKANALRDAMKAMNNDPELHQRVIMYVNSYNMVDDFGDFQTILGACGDYCRVLISEVYLGASEAFTPGGVQGKLGSRVCASGHDCFGYLEAKIVHAAPSTKGRIITALGVDAHHLTGTHLSSYCWGGKGGSLRAEMDHLRAIHQPGFATWNDARVASDTHGHEFEHSRDMYAACIRGLAQRRPYNYVHPGVKGTLIATTAPSACGRINPSQGLTSGGLLASCDGRYSLAMQGDGNVALYEQGALRWQTQTNGEGGAELAMQTDGDFVLSAADGTRLWSSDTGGHPGAYLALQNDGNLVVYLGNVPLWSSGTGAKIPAPAVPTACGHLDPGQGIMFEGSDPHTLESCDSRFVLVAGSNTLTLEMQGPTVLWSSGPAWTGAYAVTMQPDGNLVAARRDGTVLWASNTGGNPGATFALQTDGNAVVYAGQTPLWSTGTGGH